MKNAAQKLLPNALVSHFTPSLMTSATLEAILVEREDLASELVDEILGSATNPTKAQTLLVGPRGIGKTHLVTLIYHRIRAAKSENLCIAWLREEEYGVVSWLDLLLRIFRSLEEEYPGTTPQKELEPLFALPTTTAEREAQTLLQDYLAGRTLLLLVENVDAIFSDIKEAGQRKWRSWMQEHAVITTLATTPGLFSGISGRNAPFYAFFRIEHLQPLDVDGAVLLLQKLAHVRGDEELAKFIDTPAGHARVRAVHHLAGGNFRIYVVFASFLKRASLDELVSPFLQLLDELTPYYQSHLAALSAQQRKIIEVLCDHRAPMPVKLLASRGFMSPQTASSHLVELRDRGYVVPQTRGRESLYELREPLLRLCLEVKKQRGEPVALLIEFLRLWYRREELSHHLERCAPEAVWERQYLARALAEKEKETEDPHIAACERDLKQAMGERQWEKALRICDEIESIRTEAIDKARRGFCLWGLERNDEALVALESALTLESNDPRFWEVQGVVLRELDREVEALSSFEKAISLAEEQGDKDTLALAWTQKGLVLGSRDEHYKALQSFNIALKNDPNDKDVLFNKAIAQSQLSHYESSLKSFRKLEKLGYEPQRVRSGIGHNLRSLGEYKEALIYFKELAIEDPESEHFQQLIADLSLEINDFETALMAAKRAIELDANSPCFKFEYARAVLGLNSRDEGLAVLEAAVADFDGDLDHLDLHMRDLLSTLYAIFEDKPDVISHGLVQIFEEYKASPVLSAALTNFAHSIALSVNLEREMGSILNSTSETRPQARKALEWSRSWLSIFDSAAPNAFPSLRFAARLSAAAIQVAVTGDDRSLLDLPSEERAIVRDILDQNASRKRKKGESGKDRK